MTEIGPSNIHGTTNISFNNKNTNKIILNIYNIIFQYMMKKIKKWK